MKPLVFKTVFCTPVDERPGAFDLRVETGGTIDRGDLLGKALTAQAPAITGHYHGLLNEEAQAALEARKDQVLADFIALHGFNPMEVKTGKKQG